MCSRRKLIVLSVIFNFGMCFYSHALASSPYSKNSLSYLVPKDYSVTESPAVVESHPVAKSRPVVKHHRVAKARRIKRHWVVRSYPHAVSYPPIAVSLLVGGGATNIGDNHNIIFPPGSFRTDTFTTHNEPIEIAAAAGISYDFHIGKKRDKHFLQDITLGVNGYYNQSILNGAVREYGLANMANSSYDLRLKTGRLMIDTELDFSFPWGTVIPFVELGIGAASHTLYFKNSPVPSVDASGGGYVLQDHTQFRFAYEAGVGIKVPLKKKIMLSARYLYANAGEAKTSRSDNRSGVSLAKPIVIDVSSQSILFGFSYLIG